MADILAIFADSDSEAEFEGFDELDVVEVQGVGALPNFEIPELDIDNEIQADRRLRWRKEAREPLVIPFTGDMGINEYIDVDELTPYTFFKLFMDDDMYSTMSTETNRYQNQNFPPENLKTHSRMRSWYDTTPNEMKQFFGLVIIMGLVEKGDIEKYWSTDSLIATPMFNETMPRDRFLNILACFHLNNNENMPQRGDDRYDSLYKVRPLYDVAKERCMNVYTPGEYLALDEGMVPWKGRLTFKQYIPNKPDRFGMKLYIISESVSGYVSNFTLYTGKDFDPNPDGDEEEEARGHTYNVVIGMMRECAFLNKGYSLYTDNYYSSPTLFDELNASGTNAVGTARTNRKEMPQAVRDKNLKKGEAVYRQRENLLAIKWKDKRDVTVLSTKHMPTFSLTGKVNRVTREPICIPTCILEYNKYMGGVDRSDQLGKYYTITRKSMKWWKKLAFHIINLLITNSYVLYVKMEPQKVLSQFDFRKELARELIIASERRISKKGRRSVGVPEQRLVGRHFPAAIPAQAGAKNQHPCRKCIVCSEKTGKRNAAGNPKRKETRYWCPTCAKPLCVDICFERFHTLKHYRLQEDSSSSDSD
jgi:hypothetical protein